MQHNSEMHSWDVRAKEMMFSVNAPGTVYKHKNQCFIWLCKEKCVFEIVPEGLGIIFR